MKHILKTKWRIAAIMMLCCALLCSGPLRPLYAYAALSDDDDEPATISDDFYDDDDTAATSEAETSAATETETKVSAKDKYQPQLSNLSERLEALEAEKKEIESNINSAKTEKEKEQKNKSYIDSQITTTQNTIAALEEKIALHESYIEEKQQEIEKKQAEFDESYELFLKRLRAMQMNNSGSTLGLVLGADSFVDFLTRSETVVRVAQHDKTLMEELTQERLRLEEEHEELEDSKAELESDREQMQWEKSQLAEKQAAAASRIQDISELEAAYNADKSKIIAQEKEVQAEIDLIYQKIAWSTNPYAGGSMQWPVPNFYKITSEYGWRFSGTDYHTGIDISGAGVYGANIQAANDGTVVHVNWNYVNGRGYGIYLMIDHGGGISTLYGHCSNILVNVGDEVKKGQAVAQVGSTGWSTGPHLHFEVRVNGAHTNPMAYLQG